MTNAGQIPAPHTLDSYKHEIEKRLRLGMFPLIRVDVDDWPGEVRVRFMHDGSVEAALVNSKVRGIECYLADALPAGVVATVEAYAAPIGPRCIHCHKHRTEHALNGRCMTLVGGVNLFTPFERFSIDLGPPAKGACAECGVPLTNPKSQRRGVCRGCRQGVPEDLG